MSLAYKFFSHIMYADKSKHVWERCSTGSGREIDPIFNQFCAQ